MLSSLVQRIVFVAPEALLQDNPCEDLVPGTFDWHNLKNKDPYPGGEYGKYAFCPA